MENPEYPLKIFGLNPRIKTDSRKGLGLTLVLVMQNKVLLDGYFSEYFVIPIYYTKRLVSYLFGNKTSFLDIKLKCN